MGTSDTRIPRRQRLRADLSLLVVAAIWGSAFVAQRTGMEHIGPFTLNAARFAFGSAVLVPVIGWQRLRAAPRAELRGGAALGTLIFAGATCQQIGLVYTAASKAGFITGLYVVIVPLLLALMWRERVRWNIWIGAALAAAGLFLLSMRDELAELQPSVGDAWVLAGAFAWALQVIATGRIAPGKDPLRLAAIQYTVCSAASAIPAAALEWRTWSEMLPAGKAILYVGVVSTGVAYTLQIVAQRHAPPADAAIIMSLEAVFAALFGWLLLSETLSARQLTGCGLMLAGMVVAQLFSSLAHAAEQRRALKEPRPPD